MDYTSHTDIVSPDQTRPKEGEASYYHADSDSTGTRSPLSDTTQITSGSAWSSSGRDEPTIACTASCFAVYKFVHGFGAVAQRTVSGEAYLVDINRYVPLGSCVLTNPNFIEKVHRPAAPEWIEAIDTLPGRDQDQQQWLTHPLNALWISQIVRIFYSKSCENDPYITWRIYVLPEDVGRGQLHRSGKLRRSLGSILGYIDVSVDAWAGKYSPLCSKAFDVCATAEDCSLFYMFNTLPSPSPNPSIVSDNYSRTAMQTLLHSSRALIGMNSSLYPYQRRSAAMMIQREAAPKLQLDPRLEKRTAPDGQTYYYGARESLFLKQPPFYESVRGGILAETMGLGKTIMCIAAILATRSHWPTVPPVYSENRIPTRPSVGSLMQMAAAATARHHIPWRSRLEDIERITGDEMSRCGQELEKNIPFYDIPHVPSRFNRRTTLPPPQRIHLCTGTIIVVPGNLVHQWQSELQKHVIKGALRVLIMSNPKLELPPASELSKYDVVLFSRSRFEQEIRDGSDAKGRRATNGAELKCFCSYQGATRERDCECFSLNAVYSSPLKELHWLRLIIDEGHSFSSANSNAVAVADKLVRVERRWVVSGTPAKDLLGVEVELGDEENVPMRSHKEALEQRKSFNMQEEAFGAAKSLGSLASHFLKIRPWAECGSEEKAAIWDEYIYRHAQSGSRTFDGFSVCLRRTLEGMVIKTRPDDVEKDIQLPPLTHRIVRLEPSFYDKLTANIFALVLTANAVTSERTDEDYLFHRNNRKPRTQLITNLRQSAFFWTGFSEEDVRAALEHGRKYLAKGNSTCTPQDRRLLQETIANAKGAVGSVGWVSLSRSHEMGLFVKGWPGDSVGAWSFGDCKTPALMGISQLLQAQSHVNRRIATDDACAGLAEAGVQALASALDRDEKPLTKSNLEEPKLTKTGIPQSTLQVEPSAAKRQASLAASGKVALKKAQISNRKESQINTDQVQVATATVRDTSSPLRKRPRDEDTGATLPPDSLLRHTDIVGTTSSKLSYLIDRVSSLHETEKILIFYEGDNVAYYIAQALELLSITHLIYAKALTNDRRSKYVVLFDTDDFYRVLLMDVKQAAHGLNLSSASRVFFVNPVCRPNVEAQAIKRAHRIGQVRPVEVETLVLKGTVEEAMLERSRKMSRHEHLDAKSLEDDFRIRAIIQNASVIPVGEYEGYGYSQMAHLWKPQLLFGRPGRMNTNNQNKLEMELFDDVKKRSQKPSKRPRIAKKKTQPRAQTPVPESQDYGAGLDHPQMLDVATSGLAVAASPVDSLFGFGSPCIGMMRKEPFIV